MDLYSNDRFVLSQLERRTGQFDDNVFDTSVDNLRATGTPTDLTISFGTETRRVDFTGAGSAAVAGFGLVGKAIATAAADKAGIGSWVEVLRQHGVLGSSRSTGRSVLLMLGIVVLLIAAIVFFTIRSVIH